jgi:hypothetical protein
MFLAKPKQKSRTKVGSSSPSQAEAIQQVKKMVLAADRVLTDAIGFTNKCPLPLEISLEKKEESLKMLVEMEQLVIEWVHVMHAAEVAMIEVVRAIRSLLLRLDKEDERQTWTEVKANVKNIRIYWRKHVSYLTHVLARSTLASKAQWSLLVTIATPIEEAFVHANIKPPTDEEMIRYDLLYSKYAKRKYTLPEIKALEAIDCMTYAASIPLDPGKLVNDANGVFFINENRAKVLYLWTQMRARLAGL